MRVLVRLFSAIFAVFALRTALRGSAAAEGIATEPAPPVRFRRSRLVLLTIARTIAVLGILAVGGGLAAMYSGVYDIAAKRPHLAPVRWALETGRDRSIRFHSRGIEAPPLRDPERVKRGLATFRTQCEPCHGAPGVPRSELGRGINPKPPPLATAIASWSDAELYWILTYGLKMSGMPSFGGYLSEEEQWAVVAFLRTLAWLGPDDYRRLSDALAAEERGEGAPDVSWLPEGDRGIARLGEANSRRGRELLRDHGCGSCHRIPGVGTGDVGPPLDRFAERQFIAGGLVNTPATTAAWIVEPDGLRPRTAMPNLGVATEDAVDMTAYLFTLGDQARLGALRRTLE